MPPAQDPNELLQQAESLRRRWFRQLQALEGDERWHQGWQRLERLRSLTHQIHNEMQENPEEAEPLLRKLRALLREAEEE